MDHDTPRDREENDDAPEGKIVTTSDEARPEPDAPEAESNDFGADDASSESSSGSSSGPAAASDDDDPTAERVPVDADGQPLEFNWYVLRVQSGREDTCSNALRKKVMLAKVDHYVKEIAVPKQKITEIKDGKKRVRSQKLYPGYIFIHMALQDEVWYLIRDTSGIGDFVGSHQAPIPMPADEVRKIMSQMEEKEEAPEVKIDLVKNDMVKIKEGPFENFDGVVEEVQPAKGMVRVMVTIFGRATPVDLEYWQVEKL